MQPEPHPFDKLVAVASGRFVLLDDATSPAGESRSRLFTGFVRELRAPTDGPLDAFDAALDAALQAGQHPLILADYEWGARRLLPAHRASMRDGGGLRVWLFADCQRLAGEAVMAWLAACDARCQTVERGLATNPPDPAMPALAPMSADSADGVSVAGLLDCTPDLSRDAFDDAMGAIRAALLAGECYQINYTFRLHFAMFGSPFGLYRRVRARQPAAYGALVGTLPEADDPIEAGDAAGDAAGPRWLMSFSPELFVRHEAGMLLAQPMKGTAARGATSEDDRMVARRLAACEKNRAENVMIVDLLRNDLGSVAEIGSVQVPALFETQALPTVWQMTSTVTARLSRSRSFGEVMTALFPCGSITGAPKRRAIELIDALEASPRGPYTGAIGWLDAPVAGRRCGDFCLSVAIRTLELDAPEHVAVPSPLAGARVRRGRMGVGAGIVLDSEADDEWRECLLKGSFLTGVAPGFALFETMAIAGGTIAHRERHLQRLGEAARRLGFRWDEDAVGAALDVATQAAMRETACVGAARERVHRLRLELAADGRLNVSTGLLAPLPDGPVDVFVAPRAFGATQGDDPLLRFKTTRRTRYDQAWRMAEALGGFDLLFCNERGAVTEGGRSNVFARLDGHWFTPPVCDGLLPGVMRGVLLDDPAWQASERSLTLGDLVEADALIVCNALRGALPARLRALPRGARVDAAGPG